MNTFNTTEYATAVRKSFDDATTSKQELFQQAVDYFGIEALRPKTGLSLRAMQASAKPETKKKAADAAGLSLEMAEELAAMIADINKDRVNVWQDFQRAYFKPADPVAKEKTPEELAIAEQKATRKELLAAGKVLAEQVALIKAEKTVLESQGKELPAERVAQLEKAEETKKDVKAKTDALKERIDSMMLQKGLPAQIKKVTDFRKAMAKFLKTDESTVGGMSLNGILKVLQNAQPDQPAPDATNYQWFDHEGNKVD